MLLFYSSCLGLIGLAWLWVIIPAGKAFHLIRSELTDLLLAEEIGKFFPEVQDRLVNVLQLEKISLKDNSLILAGISSHLDILQPIPFANSISYQVILKYLKYAALIMLSSLLFSFFIPGIYSNSTKRVLNYTSDYEKPIPFKFDVSYTNDVAFQGEPFVIDVSVLGESVPSQVFLLEDTRKSVLDKQDDRRFTYTFDIVQENIEFQLEAAGFQSKKYAIPMENRAILNTMSITLDFPQHTGKPREMTNQGKLAVPEGTVVTWTLNAEATEDAVLKINDSIQHSFQQFDNQVFTDTFRFLQSSQYEIILQNSFGNNKEKVQFRVDVIPDEYPQIETTYYLDTILYDYVLVTGEVIDDYGITSISVSAIENNRMVHSETIKRNVTQSAFSFYHQISIDSLFDLEMPEKARSLYVSVTDNDVINNFKTTRSESFMIRLPQREELEADMSLKAQKTGEDLQKSIRKATSINDKIKDLQERLLNKKSIEWQEEKLLQQLLEQRKQIEGEIQNLLEKFAQLSKAEEKFNGKSTELQQKAEQLQKLMNDVLDQETKKMYEELQRLMEENANVEDLKNQLDQLGSSEENLEKELERALELFKRLKVESELEKASQKLDELSKKQDALANQTQKKEEEKNSDDSLNGEKIGGDELKKEQGQLNQKFEDLQEQIKNVEQLNQELKNPEPLQDIGNDLEDIKKGMKNTQEMLDQGDFKAGSQQQRENSQKMKKLGEKMSQMMQSMQMEMIDEDVNNLRNILDNLVKLSFRQEQLIDGFSKIKQVDPKFVDLSQEQLKLKDDAEIIEDSLIALSQRVVQMSSFITREIALVNENVDAALTNLRNRDRNKALSNQQFAMASINNLALLLDDLLQQMQNAMASGMSKGEPRNQKGEGLPNLKELQDRLSQQIQQLKQGQQKGRQLAENLAKMAAQQEMLREKLNELTNSLKGQPGGKEAGDAMEKAMSLMEQNEIDLVNRRLTQQLMNRQEEIISRMLDAENAIKEQELDNERKGETAQEINRNIPKAFQEYLLERKKQIELQKTIPVGLNQFYKKEVNDYFRRLSSEN